MEWAAQGPPESGKVFMPSQKPGVQENLLVESASLELIFRKFGYFMQLSLHEEAKIAFTVKVA